MLRWQIGRHVKIIVQHHAEKPFQDIRRYLQRWADRYIGAYLFCSMEQGMQWVTQRQIRNKKKIKEIMGTSSPFYVLGKGEAKSFTKVKDGINFLWVGGLDDNKDPLLVARAFVRFTKQNPSANLYMIYQTFQLLEELKTVLQDAPDAAENIHLIGRVEHDQLLYWYNSVDFIISSSHYEGSGIAVCEALSCGCIPILTDIPSFRMMSDNGKVSLLYKAGNEEALLSCLYQSLKLDRDELKRLILQHFDKRLSFDANAQSITKVVQSLGINGEDFKAEPSA
jgi:glycosyltransferase involved in cell wall biosynthesis